MSIPSYAELVSVRRRYTPKWLARRIYRYGCLGFIMDTRVYWWLYRKPSTTEMEKFEQAKLRNARV